MTLLVTIPEDLNSLKGFLPRASQTSEVTAIVPLLLPEDSGILAEALDFWAGVIERVHDLEVTLVTNGRSPDCVERKLIDAWASQQRTSYIDASGISTSKGANLNAGLMASNAPVVAFFDCDSRPSIDSIRRARGRLSDDGAVALQGPKLVEEQRSRGISAGAAFVLARIEYRISYLMSSLGSDVDRPTYFAGSNGYFSRVAATSYMFDPDSTSEDIDISARMARDGQDVMYEPAAVALEAPPNGMRSYMQQHTQWVSGWLQTIGHHGASLLLHRRTAVVWAPILLWPLAVVLAVATLLSMTLLIVPPAIAAGLVYAFLASAGYYLARRASYRLAGCPDLNARDRTSDLGGALLLPLALLGYCFIAVRCALFPICRRSATAKIGRDLRSVRRAH